jgi:hypothetical protein
MPASIVLRKGWVCEIYVKTEYMTVLDCGVKVRAAMLHFTRSLVSNLVMP